MVETSSDSKTVRNKSVFITLVNLTGLSVGVATFLIGLLVTYDVLTRTLFRMTHSWITEITMYLMAYITFVGAAYALKEGAHVSVDMLVQKLTGARRRAVLLLVDCIMFVVVAVLVWVSYQFFADAWTSNEVSDTILSVRLWIPYLSFFAGMVWLLIMLTAQILTGRHGQTDAKDQA